MVEHVLRVCIVGAESTGKTTLARDLADAFDTLFNPEYGRPYTEVGRDRDAAWTSAEFEHIARVHCWYEDFLADFARRVLFSDTDAHTTALFHELYLGAPATGFDDLVVRSHDLTLVCGLDVPWTRDEIREFAEQRRWMHEQLVSRADASNRPWRLLEGPRAVRLDAACDAVTELLASAERNG